jgi:hypothetical protein
LFKVTLVAGTSYTFDLIRSTGGLIDPYLILYGADLSTLASDDDGAGSANARITYTASSSGTYYLGAMDYDTGTGGYTLSATGGQTLTGTSAADTFTSRPGNDTIDGGAGIDTVVFNGNRANYIITKSGSTYTVLAKAGTDGTDTLQNIERLKFSDTTVALDIAGNGGQAYRVYQAAFNRTPDSGGLGFWINAIDSGASVRSVADGFVGSDEFKASYGTNLTNAQIVTKLYDNVLHRPGEAGGFNFWLGVLDGKKETLAGVLAAFSESPENQAGLLGVIGNGFAYTPFV